MAISTRFTELLGCVHPLQQAGMAGMASPDLAIAVAHTGALGMLSGVAGAKVLSAHIDAVPDGAVVGVSFLTPFLDIAALEVAAERSPLVELFWDDPDADLVKTARQGGALVGWQVGSARSARQAQDAGCDLVVAQGVEAGGHVRGTIGLLPLLDEVLSAVTVPVVAAGGIGTGRAMAAAHAAGADAVRVGTRFMATPEAGAHDTYVEALIEASGEDTVLTTAYGEGWPDAPHRVLRSSLTAGEALGEAQVWHPLWPTTATPGDVSAQALYAGESVGAVRRRQPAADIVAEIIEEAERITSSTT